MFTRTQLILRSARFHWRSNFGALLAAAAGCAVLTGALIVGDSVRYSLHMMAVERLGTTQAAVIGGDRFFKAALAERVAALPEFSSEFETAEPLLMLPGICARDGNERRANDVQVMGIRGSFWELENIFSRYVLHKFAGEIQPGEVVLNATLAAQLNAEAGDTIRLRLYKPGILPHDAPLGSNEDQSAFLRLKVKFVVWHRGIARFSLRAEQSVPPIAFLALKELQSVFDEKDAANVLLLCGPRSQELNPNAGVSGAAVVAKAWTAADAQLQLREDPQFCELRTARVFLDTLLSDELLAKEKDSQPIATYFVNAIRANGKETPYSMVTAAGAPLVDLKDDEVLLNDWAAEDLGAKPGDSVELEYYVIGNQRKVETRKASFKLKAVVPLSGAYADRTLMPDFPGIANVDSTGDWKAGIPIDKKKIRDKDEAYWKAHRGTPKAFIALKKGVELWSNRFGTYTSMRFPRPAGADCGALRERLTKIARPEKLGVLTVPVKAQALQAASQAMDFGGLFLGLSFFLIVAALLLMALIFQFGVESRARETGVLLALGFTAKSVRRLLWGEGVAAAAAGAPLGAAGGLLYAYWLLDGLRTRWQGAVGNTNLDFHVTPFSLVVGSIATVAVAALAIFFAVRKQAARPARELLNERGAAQQSAPGKLRGWKIAGFACLAVAIGLIAAGFKSSGPAAAGMFFGSGSMLLVSALAAVRWLLTDRAAQPASLPTLAALGIRAARRKPGRSQSTAALLAIGAFLVCAIGVNELDANADASAKTSGTGGFALFARATIPVFEDLNAADGREKLNLDDKPLEHAHVYALRVKSGDEASCLNLNRAQRPRIVGLPKSFRQRGGFTFVEKAAAGGDWETLLNTPSGDAIPAVCDAQSLQWALHLAIGDEFPIQDEHGNERKLKFVGAIANSVMQGSIMISEEEFLKLYPSESGFRQFLIDAPPAQAQTVADALSRGLADNGFEARPAAQRLAEFNAVQNTYLATFQALGALGMLLGSVGLGLVVLRNMLDRRAELAMLRVIGFSRPKLLWMVIAEHAWILALGLGAGIVAALAAVAPSLRVSGGAFPWQSLGLTLLGIIAVGMVSALLAAWSALRAPLLAGLRGE